MGKMKIHEASAKRLLPIAGHTGAKVGFLILTF
jgi:hypothetical protein